ncbi:response regulator transcription factor [Nocardioides bizhenqiangii]|uniref:Response regulator transcription factor n=1 Tax=Nocardioides bizhenqiangii TaxID=3095076 RepID=A0ABZ0ZVG8_9ACTN|nr:response regulator transcription factor [Nocardioides sp. HM61]WQQ28316.1 response regulator transcription factor [Nocardioides sp. HM61]
MERPIRVVLVDDHTYYRDGLVGLLTDCGVDVVDDVSSGEASLVSVPKLLPDVVVMDLSMPGLGGVEATRLLLERDPDTRVVMLTVSQDEEDILRAVLAGARGFVLKDGPVDDLVRAVSDAAAGLAYFSPRIAPRLLRHVDAPGRKPTGPNRLTAREADVIARIADGEAPAPIATALGVAESTVQDLVASVLVKIQAQSRGEIAVRAIRDRIV